MQYHFYYQKSEVTYAYRMHYKHLINSKKDVGMAVLAFGFGFLSVALIGLSLFTFAMYAIAIVFALLPVVAIYLLPLIFARKAFFQQQQQWHINNTSYTINGRSYDIKTVEDIRENPQHFRIYHGTNDFTILPKRVFADYKSAADFRAYFSKYLFTKE